MNKNTLIITTLSIIGMFAFLAGAYFLTSKPQSQAEYPELKEVQANDRTKWSTNNKIVLVEYSDLQCPGCQYFHQMFKQLEKDKDFEKIKSEVTFVYKHFPLDNIHPNARAAAYAAEAAGKQKKFFEMVDILFTKQQEWGGSNNVQALFEGYAKALKLDVEQFKTDMKSKEVQDKVQNDFLSGTKVNVQGTPTIFLDGKLLDSPQTVEDWKKLLLDRINQS